MPPTPYALVILDGFGQAPASQANAISSAHTPYLDSWFKTYPHTTVAAAGKAVGLPEGYIGNSEVGHLTIGAGRIIKQDLIRMNELLADKNLSDHPKVKTCFSQLASSQKTLHLMGLLSDAGVHSHIDHLISFIDVALASQIASIMVHPFLDGRDVAPESAEIYLAILEKKITNNPRCKIGSITGRYYAMDRDHNWDRTQQVYNMLTGPHALQWSSWQQALGYYYEQNITDEYIPPTPLLSTQLIQEHDGIIFFNFRPDRARQLTESFVDLHFDHFVRKHVPLTFFITPTDFDHTQYKTDNLLEKIEVNNTLKEVLSRHNKTIFSIAETEKYAHITYFFAGGKEEKVTDETRVLVPSIPAKNYVEFPGMSAQQITNVVIESLATKPSDFYLINYANPDMVGHSGNIQATVKAIELLDGELKKLYDIIVIEQNGTLMITGDHGKAEEMVDLSTGQPRTAHTTNPVPFLVINKHLKNKNIELKLHGLADIAPFILEEMHIPIPNEMKKQ